MKEYERVSEFILPRRIPVIIEMLQAGYLHDSVEDTQMKLSLVEKHFGERVYKLVYSVTNEVGINRKERNLKTYQKLKGFPDGTALKLADRISNVESCIINNNDKLFDMYKKEYQSFKYYLDDGVSNRAMWNKLDELLNA